MNVNSDLNKNESYRLSQLIDIYTRNVKLSNDVILTNDMIYKN